MRRPSLVWAAVTLLSVAACSSRHPSAESNTPQPVVGALAKTPARATPHSSLPAAATPVAPRRASGGADNSRASLCAEAKRGVIQDLPGMVAEASRMRAAEARADFDQVETSEPVINRALLKATTALRSLSARSDDAALRAALDETIEDLEQVASDILNLTKDRISTPALARVCGW